MNLLNGFGCGEDEGHNLVGTLLKTVFCELVFLASSLETFFVLT